MEKDLLYKFIQQVMLKGVITTDIKKNIRLCVEAAYAPATQHFKFVKINGKVSTADKIRLSERRKKSIVDIMMSFDLINILNDDFDLLHQRMCLKLVSEVNKQVDSIINELNLNNDVSNINSFTIGNAQKLINMTYKYLITFGIIDYNNPNLNKLHCPIDAHIIELMIDDLNIFSVLDCDNHEVYLKNIMWSKINDYNIYKNLQEQLRIKINEGSLIEWEFNNWKN